MKNQHFQSSINFFCVSSPPKSNTTSHLWTQDAESSWEFGAWNRFSLKHSQWMPKNTKTSINCFRLYKFMKWKYLEYWIYSWYSGLYISIGILHKVEIVTKSRYFIHTASDELACGGSIQSDMFVVFRFGVDTNIACHIWFGISKLDISLSNRARARVTYFIATSVQIKTNHQQKLIHSYEIELLFFDWIGHFRPISLENTYTHFSRHQLICLRWNFSGK